MKVQLSGWNSESPEAFLMYRRNPNLRKCVRILCSFPNFLFVQLLNSLIENVLCLCVCLRKLTGRDHDSAEGAWGLLGTPNSARAARAMKCQLFFMQLSRDPWRWFRTIVCLCGAMKYCQSSDTTAYFTGSLPSLPK